MLALAWLTACQKPNPPVVAADPNVETPTSDVGDAPWRCKALTCASLGQQCGQALDGCGVTLDCGRCDPGLACDRGTCLPPSEISYERVANPFQGARYFVKPHYTASARSAMPYAPRSLHPAIQKVSTMPTAVWLERISTIYADDRGTGLRDHLDEALLQQQSGAEPLAIVLVLYNLPDRDCAAGASAGELKIAEDGERRYRQDFIDPIVSILSEPQYRSLRVVAILEPDSLPNLVTNLDSHASCLKAAPAYRAGLAYAIEQLSSAPNTYIYLDIAHSGWLGWDNPAKAAQVYREVMRQAGGEQLVHGFATNISNYTPIQETVDPFLAKEAYVGLIESFYGWNRVVDEHSYVDALRKHFPSHGFIIDTGRNGWGSRTGQVPLDGRYHRGNWCNVQGAGIGHPPTANPRQGVHAYFWVKPPGESDGAGDPSLEREGVPYDWMCSPNDEHPTDAHPNAPAAGAWFLEAFLDLVRNAYPPL